MTSRFAVLLLITIFGAGLGLEGCGGGGGGGGSGSLSVTFTPDATNPGTNTVSLSGVVTGTNLDLTVTANAVSGSIFGAAFDLTYDPNVMTYMSYSNGNFFEQTGQVVTYAIAARNGRLIVGVAGQPGTHVNGTGAVVTLHFQAKAAGRSATQFEGQALCSSASATICDRQPSLSWSGGTYSAS